MWTIILTKNGELDRVLDIFDTFKEAFREFRIIATYLEKADKRKLNAKYCLCLRKE